MPLLVLGVSHKTAPIELREKFSLSLSELEKFLAEFKGRGAPGELVVLSTCNRTEVYCACPDGQEEELVKSSCLKFLSGRLGRTNLDGLVYAKRDRDMVEHLFSVAGGLDSLVPGEQEILKQVKDAYHLSQRQGRTGKLLNVLFQRALYIGKLVRTRTAINQGTLSVGSVAVALAEKIYGDLSESSVLLFGAGKMAEVSARYLLSKKVKKLLVANRTRENALILAKKFEGEAMTTEDGLSRMVSADIVITSVSVKEPFISREFVQDVMSRRHNRSLFFIDIAVPRNVDPSVHKIDNVYLYNVDDLESIVQDNLKNRGEEMGKASRLVSEKSEEFLGWVESLKSGREKSLRHGPETQEL